MSCGLQFFVAFEIVWKNTSKFFENQFRGEMIVRIITAILICKFRWLYFKCLSTFHFSFSFVYRFAVALAISYQGLGLFISLLGAICASMLAVSFPAILEICVLYPKLNRLTLIRNTIICLLGVIALVTGLVHSIVDIINAFSET